MHHMCSDIFLPFDDCLAENPRGSVLDCERESSRPRADVLRCGAAEQTSRHRVTQTLTLSPSRIQKMLYLLTENRDCQLLKRHISLPPCHLPKPKNDYFRGELPLAPSSLTPIHHYRWLVLMTWWTYLSCRINTTFVGSKSVKWGFERKHRHLRLQLLLPSPSVNMNRKI